MALDFDSTPLRDATGLRRRNGPQGGKNYIKPKGHVMPPGTGPEGETCGSCIHAMRFGRWIKCGLARLNWTGGRATDVLARDAACYRWEKADD